MGMLMKNMSIGSKFTMAICASAIVIMLAGLFIIYQQEEEKMDLMLTNRAKVLSQQILISRAYISQNYVGKIKKSKAGADVQVLKEPAGRNGRGSGEERPLQRSVGEPESDQQLEPAERRIRERSDAGDHERRGKLCT
jgi:hypothetical protein